MARRDVTEAMPQHGEQHALIGWAPKRSVARPRDSSLTCVDVCGNVCRAIPPVGTAVHVVIVFGVKSVLQTKARLLGSRR
jgi:hypothetical protein